MAFSAATVQSALSHHLKIATWAARAAIYLGVHLPTSLNAAVLAAAASITTNHDVPDGAKIVIDPLGANPETFYAGVVTGAGPYTVPLLDSPGGISAALAFGHAISIPVKFDPDNDMKLVIAPTSTSTALNAAVIATDTSITTDADIPDGAKVVIDPFGTNPETFYAGVVTGSGPYTVPLLDAPAGSSAALAFPHNIAMPVVHYAIGSAYVRLNYEAWQYDGVTDVETVANNGASIKLAKMHTASNSTTLTFAQATTVAWGVATHLTLHETLEGGVAIDVIEMDQPFDVVLNSILEFAVGTAKVKSGNIN